MAKFYSIGLGLLASVFAFGQGVAQFNATPTNIEEATPHFVKEESRIQLNPLSSSRSAQAAGDTIWSNDFSSAEGWQMNGFEIGTTLNGNLYNVPLLSSTGTSADNGFASYFEGNEVDGEIYIKNSIDIDLSEVGAAFLSFNSYYVHFWYNEILVAVHNSAGYSDTTAIHTDVQVNYGSSNPENIIINLSKACGDSAVTLEFIYRPGAYGPSFGWQFDDLAIIQALDKDLSIENYYINMNGIGVYGAVPSRLADSIVVYTEALNNGAETLEGVKTKLSVFDGDDNLMTSFETDHDTLNLERGNMSIVSASDELYAESNATYSILVSASSSTGDQDQLNNVVSDAWSYEITDSSYQRASYLYSTYGSSSSWGDTSLSDSANSYAFQGATYFFYDSVEISSISMLLDSAKTSPDAKLVGKIYYVDENWNRTEIYSTDTFMIDTPIINLGDQFYFQSVKKAFNKGDKDGWLAPNKRAHEIADTLYPDHYLVGVELTTPVTTTSMGFLTDKDPAHNYPYSTWVYVPGNYASWYYEDNVPHIYLNVGEVREQDVVEDNDTTDTTDSTDVTDTTDNVDSSSSINDIFNTLEMYPNPAQDVLNITGFPNADVQVFNVIGALVMERRQVSDRVSLDVAALPKGNYIVKIVSDKGVATKKVVLGN